MNIVILDDYQDAVRKLACAEKLEPYPAKVYTNTVKGVGQLSVRLRDADVLVLNRERTVISRQLIEKLPRLKLIAQTGRVGAHIDVAACTEKGVAVAEGVGSPVAPAELTWALILAATKRVPMADAGMDKAAADCCVSRDQLAHHLVTEKSRGHMAVAPYRDAPAARIALQPWASQSGRRGALGARFLQRLGDFVVVGDFGGFGHRGAGACAGRAFAWAHQVDRGGPRVADLQGLLPKGHGRQVGR